MKKGLRGMGLVMLGAVLTMVGCGGSMQEDPEGALTNGSSEESNPAPQSEDVQPGEAPENSGKGDGVEALGSCSYVQWCNEPGYWGTVCVLNPGCSYGTAANECLREVQSICGRSPIPPVDYR